MARDLTLPTRQAIVAHLRADTDVTDTAMGVRFYGERTPATVAWPFGRYGQTSLGQLGGAIPLHFFSKAQFTDEVATIMAAVVLSLDGKVLTLEGGRKLHLTWPDAGGSQIIPDADEANAWHGIVRLDAAMARECLAG